MNGGIADWVTRRATRKGSAVAIIDGDRDVALSYSDLDGAIAGLAGALHTRGVRRGDRVALLMENSIEFVQVMFATVRLGAVAVPVNYRLSAAEIAFILTDSGATVLAISEPFGDLATQALADADTVRLVIGSIPQVPSDSAFTTTTLEALAGSHQPREIDHGIHDDDLCLLVYTSGTTGRPKGAMLTHGNMLWNAINSVTIGTGYCGSTTTIAVAPMFHMGALGLSVLPVLYAGGTVVSTRSFDPIRTLEMFQRYGVTTQFMVPAMWSALSRVPDFDSFDTTSMQFVLCGGAPCPLPLIDFYQSRGWKFMEGFGMTEASPNTLLLDHEFVLSHAGSVGRPFMHVDVRIVDDEDREVEIGEVGELVVRGPNLFAGYWGLPDATARAMRGGWFHSGDLARQDKGGFITIVDRKKDMIITGGENVYPIEVEQALYPHPAVADVAVIGVADELWGETVLALIVLEDGATATEQELIQFCRSRIAHFKCPRRVEFLDRLPRNATGKVLKRDLRAQRGASQSVVDR